MGRGDGEGESVGSIWIVGTGWSPVVGGIVDVQDGFIERVTYLIDDDVSQSKGVLWDCMFLGRRRSLARAVRSVELPITRVAWVIHRGDDGKD